MDLGMEGQVVVITGAGSGIGAAAAAAFAGEGCKVGVWDVDQQSAERVAAEIRRMDGEALVLRGSVDDSAAVEEAFRMVLEEFGSVHILVNNAGTNDDAPVTEMTDEQWRRIVATNLTGAFYCARAAARVMMAQRYGRIINLSSRAHLGELNKANYCATKAGLLGLTRALAMELGPYDITVNAVAPGMVRTARVLAQPGYPGLDERARQRQLIKRVGEPDDVVNGILFYASSTSGYVTGDLMYVSGGRLT